MFHSATCTPSILEHVRVPPCKMYMFHLSILVSLGLIYRYLEAYASSIAGFVLYRGLASPVKKLIVSDIE